MSLDVAAAAKTRREASDRSLLDLGDLIRSALPEAVQDATLSHGELTISVVASRVRETAKFLRENPACQFTSLVDITAVDHPGREMRFDVVYHFLSIPQNQRIRMKTPLREDDSAPSLVSLFPAANWFEREVFDMYGVLFSDHPDLRRLLTDYGFRGYPLRKDFPTTGYTEVRYDEVEKRVVYEPVKLTQEYRLFDFMSPWEGADYILPGDEKSGDTK